MKQEKFNGLWVAFVKGRGAFAKKWSYLISLFKKNDDEGGGGKKIEDVFYERPQRVPFLSPGFNKTPWLAQH